MTLEYHTVEYQVLVQGVEGLAGLLASDPAVCFSAYGFDDVQVRILSDCD